MKKSLGALFITLHPAFQSAVRTKMLIATNALQKLYGDSFFVKVATKL